MDIPRSAFYQIDIIKTLCDIFDTDCQLFIDILL